MREGAGNLAVRPADRGLVRAKLRALARDAYYLPRSATARYRRPPDFLIIGGQKCGTTALFSYLSRHPGMKSPSKKEVHYFDLNFDRTRRWYMAHFPLRITPDNGTRITGEASPYYVFHPSVPARVADFSSDIKLVVLLRNPVDRAYSGYQHSVRWGLESLTFEEAVDAEDERLEGEAERLLADPGAVSFAHRHYSYLARGRYVEQLERWLHFFPKSHLLAVRSEDMFNSPQSTYDRVCGFLGLKSHILEDFPNPTERSYERMSVVTRRRLEAYFRPFNSQLKLLLDQDIGWEEITGANDRSV